MSDLCNEINSFGKGIGNEGRYRIIQSLTKGAKTVTELVEAVTLSQPAVSQHLKTLKECKLVTSERNGKEIYYQINSEYTLQLLESLVKDIQKSKEQKEIN